MAHTKVVSVDIAIAQELKDDYEEPPHSAEGKEAVKGTEADDPFQNPDKVDDAAETIRALEKMLVCILKRAIPNQILIWKETKPYGKSYRVILNFSSPTFTNLRVFSQRFTQRKLAHYK